MEVRLGSQSRLISDLRQISAFEMVRIHPLLPRRFSNLVECSELIIPLRRVQFSQPALDHKDSLSYNGLIVTLSELVYETNLKFVGRNALAGSSPAGDIKI